MSLETKWANGLERMKEKTTTSLRSNEKDWETKSLYTLHKQQQESKQQQYTDNTHNRLSYTARFYNEWIALVCAHTPLDDFLICVLCSTSERANERVSVYIGWLKDSEYKINTHRITTATTTTTTGKNEITSTFYIHIHGLFCFGHNIWLSFTNRF